MPWIEAESINERVKFVARYLDGMDSPATLGEEFGVSRKTGYKWIHRFSQHWSA